MYKCICSFIKIINFFFTIFSSELNKITKKDSDICIRCKVLNKELLFLSKPCTVGKKCDCTLYNIIVLLCKVSFTRNQTPKV